MSVELQGSSNYEVMWKWVCVFSHIAPCIWILQEEEKDMDERFRSCYVYMCLPICAWACVFPLEFYSFTFMPGCLQPWIHFSGHLEVLSLQSWHPDFLIRVFLVTEIPLISDIVSWNDCSCLLPSLIVFILWSVGALPKSRYMSSLLLVHPDLLCASAPSIPWSAERCCQAPSLSATSFMISRWCWEGDLTQMLPWTSLHFPPYIDPIIPHHLVSLSMLSSRYFHLPSTFLALCSIELHWIILSTIARSGSPSQMEPAVTLFTLFPLGCEKSNGVEHSQFDMEAMGTESDLTI